MQEKTPGPLVVNSGQPTYCWSKINLASCNSLVREGDAKTGSYYIPIACSSPFVRTRRIVKDAYASTNAVPQRYSSSNITLLVSIVKALCGFPC